ncbi:MltA domain-containing protein [Thalassotalea sp. LPB0316]|uniref:MltA domain-containing protein n=1 Tax=Thalassotalea sp. LPB0316 TaxID=2769490 RepID=UPI001868A2EB|nr:MltA domain-containing protein [Thalassotalea sp. LPB0316]QOL26567.1 MltA domain-containing protein [Thalassotalea sp. LPB0316]
MYKFVICITLLTIFFSPVNRAGTFIKQNSFNIAPFTTNHSEQLCQVARSVLKYQAVEAADYAWSTKPALPVEVSEQRVKATLSYLCQLVEQGQGERLTDPQFLEKNFDLYQWQPDLKTAHSLAKASNNQRKSDMLMAIPSDKIFLTKYYTKRLKGSERQTNEYSVALYQLPEDEQGLSKAQALKQKSALTRFKYTRQQIIAGALDKQQLAKPLIWLSEDSLHDVLLQGTGVLEVDGKLRYFNVHRNNGIAYDYTLGKREQARYWYFKEVNGIKGYGHSIESKIDLQPRVSFAGNIKQIGLGKLFLISFEQVSFRQSHLGILADEGGAFDDNLFQLDWLVESYFGWQDYYQANKQYPDYASAWLLLKKQ